MIQPVGVLRDLPQRKDCALGSNLGGTAIFSSVAAGGCTRGLSVVSLLPLLGIQKEFMPIHQQALAPIAALPIVGFE